MIAMQTHAANRTWAERLLLTLVGIVILVLGFFFLTIALVAGAILAAIIGARLWWQMRKLKRAAAAHGPMEGEYVVVERETHSRNLQPPNE